MKYPDLYALSSTGKTLIWWMEQADDKYRTISGQLDGKLITSEWTKALPKNIGKVNETSGIQQASLEIESQYTKKKKKKYFTDIRQIGQISYFSPMLAKKYNEYKDKIDFFDGSWLIQVKLNGMRCVMNKSGSFTRTGERIITIPHIEEQLIHFFNNHDSITLDGELYNYNLRQRLNELISLCRKTKDVTAADLLASKDQVKYYVYDMFNEEHPDMIYTNRKTFIDTNLTGIEYIGEVQCFDFSSEEELMKIYNVLVDDGQEGIMLRKKNSVYEQKRSKNLLKAKPEDSSEATIVDVKEGEGNWQGTGKVITLNWNGLVFDATFKGTMEEGKQFLNDRNKWIGQIVTFLYNGKTGLNVPNFARVDYNNCLKN